MNMKRYNGEKYKICNAPREYYKSLNPEYK